FFIYYPDQSHGEIIYVHYVDTEDVANIDVPVITEPKNRTGNPVRIVQVKGDPIDYSTLLAPTEKVDMQWLYPSFTYTRASYPEPGKEITFTACYTTYHGFKTSFNWDFGDGTYGSGSSVKHSYEQDGEYNVTLTVITRNLITGEEVSQTVAEYVYVHSKHRISYLPSDLHATSLLTDEDLTQVPQNTYNPTLITKSIVEEIPIAELGVHFEEAAQDIDLSGLVADVNLGERKSVIYMPSWPAEIEEYKLLFIPSTGAGAVYICLNATSLEEVSLENADMIIHVGETIDEITLTTTFYNGREYYVVSGITGTGGGELIDNIPPKTTLIIGEPKYVTDTIYVTPDTPFSLNATDNLGGTGVALTAYKIRNATYDSGWLTYTVPFCLTGLVDGIYTINYNSTDKAGNVEPSNTINVTLFSWNYVFTDSYGRGTTLKINLAHQLFQFITPDKDYGIREATYMRQCGRTIIIKHCDDELRLITAAVDTKLDFCVAIAWDQQTSKRYFLIDKVGNE
ncbi:MAG: PKD domain-containing protein, partial [Candidatus Bathyarchaeia archaeon]